jgi:hypothetical protein
MPIGFKLVLVGAGVAFFAVLVWRFAKTPQEPRKLLALFPFFLVSILLMVLPFVSQAKITAEGLEIAILELEARPGDAKAVAKLEGSLAKAESQTSSDPELQAKMAKGFAAVGDTQKALDHANRILDRSPEAFALAIKLDRDLTALGTLADQVSTDPTDEAKRLELQNLKKKVEGRPFLSLAARQIIGDADSALAKIAGTSVKRDAFSTERDLIKADRLSNEVTASPRDTVAGRRLDSALVSMRAESLSTPNQMLTASKLLRTAGRVAEARKFTDALEKRFPKSTEAQAVRKLKW